MLWRRSVLVVYFGGIVRILNPVGTQARSFVNASEDQEVLLSLKLVQDLRLTLCLGETWGPAVPLGTQRALSVREMERYRIQKKSQRSRLPTGLQDLENWPMGSLLL